MPTIIKCKNCENEIDRLYYTLPATEFGDAFLGGNNEVTRENELSDLIVEFNATDTSRNGQEEYRCPECDEIIETIDDLIIEREEEPLPQPSPHAEENEESNTDSPIHSTIPANLLANTLFNPWILPKKEETYFLICPKCETEIILKKNINYERDKSSEEKINHCPKCGAKI